MKKVDHKNLGDLESLVSLRASFSSFHFALDVGPPGFLVGFI